MNRWIWLAAIGMAVPLSSQGQTTANPVLASAQMIVTRQSKYIVAAAEEMPAEKYSYHPTEGQMSFGHILAHIAQSDNHVCALISGTPAPQGPQLTETSPKDALIEGVKASFTFCDQALAGTQDAKLGDMITFFGGAQVPRARAVFEVTGDLEDHYSQLADYLRMNGLTPPSVRPMAQHEAPMGKPGK